MTQGFLYVLLNPAMPGLLKVGKTTRDPSDRVAELSSATGVPSPFVLAYQQPVIDCHAAEKWVHGELERAGHRVADNREFFSAPLHEIVGVIARSVNVALSSEDSNALDSRADGVGDADNLDMSFDMFLLAVDYMKGTTSTLKDEVKALELFEQSALMGFQPAMYQCGRMFWDGKGCRKNAQKAFEWLKKSVSNGRWESCSDIAILLF